MNLRTYRAATIQEALQMVRRDLGPDAAVVQAQQVRARGLSRFLPGRNQYEVVATRDVQVRSRIASRIAEHDEGINLEAPRPLERPAPRSEVHDELKGQIAELQAMVQRLCQQAEQPQGPDLQSSLFRLYTDLIEAEVSEQVARELVERIRRSGSAVELASTEVARDRLFDLLLSEVRVTGAIRPALGKCHTVALVGPTGVGKTTTIAKLAANFRLREKRRVGLITVDTYRVAAVEQLRTYAEIIDLPMEVVSTPREMRGAVERLSGQDMILIDTAGRSPSDEVKIQELRALLNEARADEVHLVQSSVASAANLRRIAERFAPAAPTAVLFTKLDEALTLGNILELLTQCKLPVSYLTDGQNVPDDIQPADAEQLVQRLLRADVLTA